MSRSQNGAGSVRPTDRLHDQTGNLLITDYKKINHNDRWQIKWSPTTIKETMNHLWFDINTSWVKSLEGETGFSCCSPSCQVQAHFSLTPETFSDSWLFFFSLLLLHPETFLPPCSHWHCPETCLFCTAELLHPDGLMITKANSTFLMETKPEEGFSTFSVSVSRKVLLNI